MDLGCIWNPYYSRTPLIRPPSESHWRGRIRGMVAREGFIYEQKPLSVTRNVVVWEGWSLVRVVARQGFYCSSECYPELHNVCKPCKWATATTTISVPAVLMVTDFKLQFMGSLTRRSIRLYASSCEHGWSPPLFWHSCPRNRKSSSSCHHFVRSLFFQFPGRLAWLDTRLRVPVPMFALVASFRLSFMYTSQTRSTRWVYPVPKTHVGWIRPFHIRRMFSIPRLEKYAQHHPGLLLPHAGYSRDSWISLSLEESN